MNLRDYQQDLFNKIHTTFRAGCKNPLVVSPTGSGKCFAPGTMIMMSDGTLKEVEKIRIGDKLMGIDSKPRNVISLGSGTEEMFQVTPKKGSSYTVNKSHILSLKITGTNDSFKIGKEIFKSGDIANITVDQYLSSTKTFKHCAKGWRSPVDFTEKELPIALPPYILGAWLGDGHSRKPSFTGADPEIFMEVKQHAAEIGITTRLEVVSGKCDQLHITSQKKTGRGESLNTVKTALKNLNLIKNKHIPYVYKANTREVRLEVLAGLMDTDGHLGKNGGFDYITKLEVLADDVCFIARSLGFAAYKKQCRKTCTNNGVTGTYYRVSINGHIDQIPCRIKRKKAPKRRQIKNVLLTGISVKSVGIGKYYGFEIDGDRLLLLSDFTVVHNTVLFSYIANRVQSAGNRVMILVHRKELVTQTSRTFTSFGIPHGIIQTGVTPNPSYCAQIAMVQTLARRIESTPPPNLIIIDEAHHCAAGQYRQIITAYPKAHVLGVTATPQRLDGKGLADFFSEIIMGPSVEWLMDQGFLSRPKYYAPPIKADFSSVKKRGGDFAQDQAAAAMDKATITGDAVNHYAKICNGMPAIAFCVTVAHAMHVSDQFNSAGIPSATIHANMSNDERRDIVTNLANGKISVMTSCDIVSEGFDVPVVGAAILLRPTTSLGLHLQQIGRVLRPCKGKDYSVILDHVGNLLRHGLAEDHREWSLAGQDKKAKKSESLGLRQCKKCFCLHKPAPLCPECGHIQPEPKQRKLSVIEGNLEEFSRMPISLALKECKTRADLKALQKAKSYKPGWVYYMAKELNL